MSRHRIVSFLALVALSAGCASPAAAPASSKSASADSVRAKIAPVKEERALKALKEMSDALAGAKSMSFESASFSPLRGPNGQWIHILKTAHVELQRPNGLRIEASGDAFPQHILFDGKTYTVVAKGPGLYSQTEMPGSIDSMLASAAKKAGDVFTFSDVLISDPYSSWMTGLEGAVYVGESTRGKEILHHLALTANNVDWEVWIGEKDHLPRIVNVKYTGEQRSPSVMIEFYKWKLNAHIPASHFTFKAPSGARKAALKAPQDTGAAVGGHS